MANRRVHACLLGEWHDLEKEDPKCVMGTNHQTPTSWFEEGALMYGGYNVIPEKDMMKKPDDIVKSSLWYSYIDVPYVLVHFKGETYRVNPSQIQVLGE